jgi:hypothetical protein
MYRVHRVWDTRKNITIEVGHTTKARWQTEGKKINSIKGNSSWTVVSDSHAYVLESAASVDFADWKFVEAFGPLSSKTRYELYMSWQWHRMV